MLISITFSARRLGLGLFVVALPSECNYIRVMATASAAHVTAVSLPPHTPTPGADPDSSTGGAHVTWVVSSTCIHKLLCLGLFAVTLQLKTKIIALSVAGKGSDIN